MRYLNSHTTKPAQKRSSRLMSDQRSLSGVSPLISQVLLIILFILLSYILTSILFFLSPSFKISLSFPFSTYYVFYQRIVVFMYLTYSIQKELLELRGCTIFLNSTVVRNFYYNLTHNYSGFQYLYTSFRDTYL
jgi:hypothetical protein